MAHYKSELHKYNLKRKTAGLAPITRAVFERMQALAAQKQQASGASGGSGSSGGAAGAGVVLGDSADGEASASAVVDADGDKVERERERAAAQLAIDEAEAAKPVDLCRCFFDAHVSPNIAQNMEYMHRSFGFFVPDLEYMSDLHGFLTYVYRKVAVGRMCLYCERVFRSKQATIDHMVAKSHCKLRWDYDEDVEEFEEFFDFPNVAAEERAAAMAAAEGGGGAGGAEEYDRDVEYVARSKRAQAAAGTMEFAPSGNLVLRDGNRTRVVGHRAFKVYYKQHFKAEDTRPEVVAYERERAIQLYKRAGVDTSDALTLVRLHRLRARPLDAKAHKQRSDYLRTQQRQSAAVGIQGNLRVKNATAGTNLSRGGFEGR